MLKIVVGLGILFAAALFALFYAVTTQDARDGIIPPPPRAVPEAVTIFAQYQDGIHRFTGEIPLPHSCYLLTRSVEARSSNPKVAVINIRTEDKSAILDTCSHITTRYPFDVTYAGEANVTPIIEVDGTAIPVKVVRREWGTGRELPSQ